MNECWCAARSTSCYLKVAVGSVGDKVQLILQAAHIPQIVKGPAEAAPPLSDAIALLRSQRQHLRGASPPNSMSSTQQASPKRSQILSKGQHE